MRRNERRREESSEREADWKDPHNFPIPLTRCLPILTLLALRRAHKKNVWWRLMRHGDVRQRREWYAQIKQESSIRGEEWVRERKRLIYNRFCCLLSYRDQRWEVFFVIDQWSDGALFTLLEEIVSTIKLLRRRGRKKLSRGAALRWWLLRFDSLMKL